MKRYAYTRPNRRRANRDVSPNPCPPHHAGGTSANDHMDSVPFFASSSHSPPSPPRMTVRQLLELTTSHLDRPKSTAGVNMNRFASSSSSSPPIIEAVSNPPSSPTIAASNPSFATDGNPSSPPRNGDNNERREASLSPLIVEESVATTSKRLKVGPLSQKDLILRERIKYMLSFVKLKPSESGTDSETPTPRADVDDEIFDDQTISYRDDPYGFVLYCISKMHGDDNLATFNCTEDGPSSQPSNEAVLDPPSTVTIAASEPSSPPSVPDPLLLANAGEPSSPPRVPDPLLFATASEPSSPPRNGANLDVSSSLATTSMRQRESSSPLSQEESVATTAKRQKVGPSSLLLLEDKPSQAEPISWEKIKSKPSPSKLKPAESDTDHQTATAQIDKDGVIPDETTSYMDKAYQFLLSSFARKRRDNK